MAPNAECSNFSSDAMKSQSDDLDPVSNIKNKWKIQNGSLDFLANLNCPGFSLLFAAEVQ